MKGHTPPIIAYVSEIVYDIVYLNPVPNARYWFTSTTKRDRDITLRLKQVLLPTITIMKIDNKNKLLKRCKNKQVDKLGALRISYEDVDELIEKIHT